MSVAPGDGRAPDADTAVLLSELRAKISDELLDRALTHRSFAYENGGLPTNERLEFLGDSVLGLIVTDTLFRLYPDLPEGNLAKLRAAVVNMRALADVARGLGLGGYIRLGKGEEGTGGRDKSSILADTLEAIIGAVYLDCGLVTADGLVHRLFDPVIAGSARLGAGLDWKTSLQELTAAEFLGVPEYLVEESGPDHQKTFRAMARIGGRIFGEGEGRSKKEAEQQAAEAAWTAITESLSTGPAEPGDPAEAAGEGDVAGRSEPVAAPPPASSRRHGGPGQSASAGGGAAPDDAATGGPAAPDDAATGGGAAPGQSEVLNGPARTAAGGARAGRPRESGAPARR